MYWKQRIHVLTVLWVTIIGCIGARANIEVVLSLRDVEFRTDATTGKKTALVTQGESFGATVMVRGSTRQPDKVYIEGGEHFHLSGPSVMQSMRSINGVTSFETRYTFEVVGAQQGIFTFGPAHVTFGRDDLTSDAYSIKVEDVLVSSEREQQQEERHARRAPERQAYLRLLTSTDQVFVGQPVVLTVAFYHGDSIPAQSFQLTPVHTPGFVTREVEGFSVDRELFKGVEFNVIRKKIALIPMSSGEHTIPAVRGFYNVPPPAQDRFNDPFLSMFAGHRLEQKQALSNVVALNVKELPVSAQHVDGIGKFNDFSVQVDRTEVVQNEPVTLKVSVAGNGNVENLDRLTLKLPSHIKLYDPKVTFNKDLSRGTFGGVKTFEYVMQVRRPGKVTIPAQTFSYFDPKRNTVDSLSSTPIELSVAPGEHVLPQADSNVSGGGPPSHSEGRDTSSSSTGSAIARHSDIRFIDEDGAVFYQPGIFEYIDMTWFFILVLLPLLLFIGHAHRLIGRLCRFHRASRTTKSLLGAMKKDMIRAIDNNMPAQVRELFIEFFMQISGTNRAYITEEWIRSYLRDKGLARGECDHFISFLTQCAAYSFAQSTSLNRIAKNDLKRAVKQWVSQLDEVLG